MLAAKAVGPAGRVLVWEPERHSREVLEVNRQRNAVSNVEIFPTALGASSGTAELHVGTVIGNISLLSGAVLGAPAERQTVPIEAGDAQRRRAGLPIPRAVKIDVEGSERAVLAGLRETLSYPECRFLCCEVHPAFLPEGIGTDDVLGAITACGFTLSGVRMSRDPFQVLAWKGEGDVLGGACTRSS
jgi:FkbM family methyltransferase